ncbi:2-phosphoglycolate phosphatase [Suillus spraguei]|nr:2-phosphoglycolate phosphatase [Suillus spraguei]
MPTHLTTRPEYSLLIDRCDTWMLDCDGVLWHSDQLIEGVAEEILRKRGACYGRIRILFVTNNASKSRKSYQAKFDTLGVEASVDDIYGSTHASAVYLKLPKDKKVYVIGMAAIEEELREEGISFIGGTVSVICGLDPSVNYTKLSKAFQYLTRNPGCRFLITNEDSTFPTVNGLLPAAGAISIPLRFALEKDPISIGKPAKTMLECIQAKVKFDPEPTIMIGDRLNTDILFGQTGGLATLLVLTSAFSNSTISPCNESYVL